jgi:hypothetical protein
MSETTPPEDYEPINGSNEDSPHYGITGFGGRERRRMVIVPRKARIEGIEKGKKGERIILDEGTRDALPPLIGRVYTPRKGVEVWSLPAESRDAEVSLETDGVQIFFAVKNMNVTANGVPWFWGYALQKGENRGDPLTVIAAGYTRKWDIQRNNRRPD